MKKERARTISNANLSGRDLLEIRGLLRAYAERIKGWSKEKSPHYLAGEVHPLTTLATGIRDIWRRAGGKGPRGGKKTTFYPGDPVMAGTLVSFIVELLNEPELAGLVKFSPRTIERHAADSSEREAARASERARRRALRKRARRKRSQLRRH